MKLQKRTCFARNGAGASARRSTVRPICPRLTVCFTNKHIHAQCVDDVEHKTLVSASTLSKGEKAASSKSNIAGAKDLGREIAEKALGGKIETVVFDRNGRKYHGCVQAFADAAREAGLKF